MRRRVLLGIAAIGVLEDGITGSRAQTLDRDSVRQGLSSPAVPATASSKPPTGTAAPASPGDEVTKVLRTEGGSVTARCAAGRARLVAWSPRQGFEAEDARRGPAREASLKFESDDAEYEVTVTCGPDGPTASSRKDDGHRRGHGGRGRG